MSGLFWFPFTAAHLDYGGFGPVWVIPKGPPADDEDEWQPHWYRKAGRPVEGRAVLLHQGGDLGKAGEEDQQAGPTVGGGGLRLFIHQEDGRDREKDGAGLPEDDEWVPKAL